jgi:hypothetical protein
VKAIVRRLARLEDRYVPREDAESARILERIRRGRERVESMGHPLPPPLVYDGGIPWSIADRIDQGRRNNIREHGEEVCGATGERP